MRDRFDALRSELEDELTSVADQAAAVEAEFEAKRNAVEAEFEAKCDALVREFDDLRETLAVRRADIQKVLDRMDGFRGRRPAELRPKSGRGQDGSRHRDASLARDLAQANSLEEQAILIIRARGTNGLSTRNIIDIAAQHDVHIKRESLASQLSKTTRSKQLRNQGGQYFLHSPKPSTLGETPRAQRSLPRGALKRAIVAIIEEADTSLSRKEIIPRVSAYLQRSVSEPSASKALAQLDRESAIRLMDGRKWGLTSWPQFQQAAE